MINIDLKVKICPSCKEIKDLKEFNKCKKNKDGLQSYCKLCNKNYFKKHKSRLTGLVISKRKEYNAERLFFVMKFLKETGCIDCGEKDPIVLEFDHVRGIKIKEVGRMVQCAYSMKKN